MGIIGNYRRITIDELAGLQKEPELIISFLVPDDNSESSDERYLDIDKAWHGIHFLLTGREVGGEPPLKNAVLGGTPLGNPENPGFDFGPACFLTPNEVQEVAEALGEISEDDLKARFNSSALAAAHIHPSATWEPRMEKLYYLMSHYVRLVAFFQEAKKCRDAVLFYLT